MSAALSSTRLLRAATICVIAFVALGGVLAAAFGLEASRLAELVPGCPLRALFGMPCPGCGITRALLLLGSGELRAALVIQPLALPLLLGMVWFAITSQVPAAVRHPAFGVVALVAVLGLWGVRAATGSLPL